MDEFLRRQPAIVPPPSFSNSLGRSRRPMRTLIAAALITPLILYVACVPKYYAWKTSKSGSVANNGIGNTVAGFDSVLKVDPKNVSALIAKSVALANEGTLESGEQAATVARQAITLAPNSAEAYRAFGYASEIQHKYAAAHVAYQSAIALDPGNTELLLSDAHIYALEGNSAKAVTAYTDILAKHPTLYEARLVLAHVEAATKKTDAAMKDFKTVYTDSKNARERAEAARGMGEVQSALRKLDSARQYMTDAITVDPTYASGWIALGTVNSQLASSTSAEVHKQFLTGAATAFGTAVKLDLTLAQAHLQLAVTAYALGQTGLARTELAAAALAVPKDATLTMGEKALLPRIITALTTHLEQTK